jgi:haloacetate dehalogenase
MRDFTSAEIQTGETSIFVRASGSGPPLLLLHGFPQTHLMWRGVAPLLAREFTVVCADLRGYGQSGCPTSTPDHAAYAKRTMARDMVTVMERLGFSRFCVAGHDRGGRVAYRMALDHPNRIERLAVLDILPVETAWERADADFALGYWPWSLLAQPEPLPEHILVTSAEAIVDNALSGWGSSAAVFSPDVREAYVKVLRDPDHAHAICEEYRAAAGLDRAHDRGVGRRRAKSGLRCSSCGARKVRSTAGTPRARSRYGATGPMTSADIRSRAGIFSRKPSPNKPLTLCGGFFNGSE